MFVDDYHYFSGESYKSVVKHRTQLVNGHAFLAFFFSPVRNQKALQYYLGILASPIT